MTGTLIVRQKISTVYCCSSNQTIAEDIASAAYFHEMPRRALAALTLKHCSGRAAVSDLPEMPSSALEIIAAPTTTLLLRLVLQPLIYLRCLVELWKSWQLLPPHHSRGWCCSHITT